MSVVAKADVRKTLEQTEIDALFSKAQAAGPAPRESGAQKIQPWDLQSSNKLTADQAAALTTIHESLARRLSSSIGVHLRVAFEMNLVSVEQLTYREFLGRLPDLTYFCSMHLMPIDARSAICGSNGTTPPDTISCLNNNNTNTVFVTASNNTNTASQNHAISVVDRRMSSS